MIRLLLFIFIIIIVNNSYSQNVNDYRSISNGNWTTVAIWEIYNGSAWVAATTYPGQITGTNDVNIQGGNNITINTNITNTINSVTVGDGGGANDVLTISNTSSINTKRFNILVDGTLTWTSNVSFTLPENTVFIVETGSNGVESGRPGCSASQRLIIGTNRYATCNGGAGADFSFDELNNNGGTTFIIGYVFEDLNYPGGIGRDLATSSGVGISNVTIELYLSGSLYATTLTDATGEYAFGSMPNDTYSVRAVNSTVSSSRGGGAACTTCLPIQTFRRNYLSTGYNDVFNEIGGNNPINEDVASGILTNAQSVSSVFINDVGIRNIDFGFNFNTIVNTNATGQGSLAQFVSNANNLDETGLDIEANSIFDPAAGEDVSIFMIPSSSDPLGRTTDPNFTSGYFDINLSTDNIQVINGDNTHIDGRTQTAYSGDTNAGTVGNGGTVVGTSANTLPDFNRPEIQIRSTNGNVLRVGADNITLRNLAIYAGNNAGIQMISGSSSIQENFIGVNALGNNTGSAIDDGVIIQGGTILISSNFIAENQRTGVRIDGGTSTTVEDNEISDNGTTTNCDDNIRFVDGTGVIIQRNLIERAASVGLDSEEGTSGAIIRENTIRNNGLNGACQRLGLRVRGSNFTVSNNIINNNSRSGIVVGRNSATGNTITQNSIYANGELGIDLSPNAGNGVTLNDTNDADSGPNNYTNFPVISNASVGGTTLNIQGWSRPGAVIEIFLTDINEGTASAGDNQIGGVTQDYGEGQIYLGTVIEGSAADLDTGTSFYNDADGNTDNTNRFTFSITIPITVPVGSLITTTATVAGSTSEFSSNYTLRVGNVITNREITYRVTPAITTTTPTGGTPTGAPTTDIVFDNFQDGNGNAPFSLIMRNTQNRTINSYQVYVQNVPYASIPSLNLGSHTMEITDNGDGTYNYLFTSTASLAPFESSRTITGGLPSPAGTGSACGCVSFYEL